PSGKRGVRPGGPSARQQPRPPAYRTRPRPWHRTPHALCARWSSRTLFVVALASNLAKSVRTVMSEDRPILYGRYASPFVRRVAVTLQLYGLKYRHMPMMPFGPDKAELAKFNPIARVPALQIADGEMLVDSAVILDYLDGLAGPERSLT